jgi:hypothetical protein
MEGCVTAEGYTLLYVGISPDKRGKPNSRSKLKKAPQNALQRQCRWLNASTHTWCTVSEVSSSPLRRVGSGSIMTFTYPG